MSNENLTIPKGLVLLEGESMLFNCDRVKRYITNLRLRSKGREIKRTPLVITNKRLIFPSKIFMSYSYSGNAGLMLSDLEVVLNEKNDSIMISSDSRKYEIFFENSKEVYERIRNSVIE